MERDYQPNKEYVFHNYLIFMVFDVSFGRRKEDKQTRWWNEEVQESEGKEEVSTEQCDSRGDKVEKSYWEAAWTAKRGGKDVQ